MNHLSLELTLCPLYRGRNWVTEWSHNWPRSQSLEVVEPGVKPRGTWLQNLNFEHRNCPKKRPKPHHWNLLGRPAMCGRGAPSSGRSATVQDRRRANGALALLGPISRSLSHTHARARTHICTIWFSRGRPRHLHLLIYNPGHAAPTQLPLSLVRLHLQCKPQGTFWLLLCVSFFLSEPGSP